MTLRIIPEPDFIEASKRASPGRRDAARATLVRFQREPASPRLDFRPLTGHPGYFVIEARRGARIVLRKDAEDLFAAVDYVHLTKRPITGGTPSGRDSAAGVS